MNLFKRAGALALFVPVPALASDGFLTLVVGIPVLLVATIVFAVLLAIRSRNLIKTLATILFVPTLLFGLYSALDAVTLLRDFGTENFSIGLAFFALLVLVCVLFFLIVRGHSKTR